MRHEATKEIKRRVESFYHGKPQHIEVEVAEGVYFDSDSSFDEDLLEPRMTAAIIIEGLSPHNEGVPDGDTTLMRYSEFGDEVVADVIDPAVHEAGAEFDELVFEYSPNNSDEDTGFLVFLGSLPNFQFHDEKIAA